MIVGQRECVSVLVTVRSFADYDMTERETRSRQTRMWCFSAWLESSGTPFVFIHAVDRSSPQLTTVSACLYFSCSLSPLIFLPQLLFFSSFNSCDYYSELIIGKNESGCNLPSSHINTGTQACIQTIMSDTLLFRHQPLQTQYWHTQENT